VVFKKIFGKKEDEREYSIDDLIVLERYDEAEAQLREALKRRKDLHLHLKLAEVYVGLRQVAKAVEEYVYVAEKYAGDGFHDRAIALLTKARRLNPMDDTLPKRIDRFEQARQLERRQVLAQEGFLLGQREKARADTAVLEFQGIWRGLQKTRLPRELSGEQLKLLFQGVEVVELERDEALARRGEEKEVLYLLTGGEVKAQIDKDGGGQHEIRTFGPGQVLGEDALFGHRPWPADYRASTRTTLLELTTTGLEICLKGNPDPRGFLDALRRDHTDRAVAEAVARLERS
jgi:tetratricopeptide (TPR) repeat protein